MRIKKIAPISVQTTAIALGADTFGGDVLVQAEFTFPSRNGLTIDKVSMAAYAYLVGGTPNYIPVTEAFATLEFKTPQSTDVIADVVQTTHPLTVWDTASTIREITFNDKFPINIGLKDVKQVLFRAGQAKLADVTPTATYKGQIRFIFEYSYDG